MAKLKARIALDEEKSKDNGSNPLDSNTTRNMRKLKPALIILEANHVSILEPINEDHIKSESDLCYGWMHGTS